MSEFSTSPEAQEYIKALQDGSGKLPAGASTLERTALEKLRTLKTSLQASAQQAANAEKQIQQLQAQRNELGNAMNRTQGQMLAYAEMLVSAEGARRHQAEKQDAPRQPAPKRERAPRFKKPA